MYNNVHCGDNSQTSNNRCTEITFYIYFFLNYGTLAPKTWRKGANQRIKKREYRKHMTCEKHAASFGDSEDSTDVFMRQFH